MPIIVEEVVISVEVGNGEAGGSSAASSGAASPDEKQSLVEECVARVLEILREREEP